MSRASIATSRRDVAVGSLLMPASAAISEIVLASETSESVSAFAAWVTSATLTRSGYRKSTSGMVVGGLRGGGDPADELGARLERTGPETRLDATEQHAPVGQIRVGVELRRCHLVGHDPNATRRSASPQVCVTGSGDLAGCGDTSGAIDAVASNVSWRTSSSTPATSSPVSTRPIARCSRTSRCRSTRAPRSACSAPTAPASRACCGSWPGSTTASAARPG